MTSKTPHSETAAPGSILDQLAQVREKIEERNFIDLSVPRWSDEHDLEICVRYRPLDYERVRKTGEHIKNATRSKDKAKAIGRIELEQNIDLLIDACEGVFAVVNGEKLSLNAEDRQGDWTRFDRDLARALGIDPELPARMICRKLFFTDGDVLGHATKVAKFSGYDPEQEAELEGK